MVDFKKQTEEKLREQIQKKTDAMNADQLIMVRNFVRQLREKNHAPA